MYAINLATGGPTAALPAGVLEGLPDRALVVVVRVAASPLEVRDGGDRSTRLLDQVLTPPIQPRPCSAAFRSRNHLALP